MLDSYIQKADMTKTVFQENDENYSAEYTQLLHIYDLISKTSDTYYDILTDQMETQNEQLIQIDRYTTLLSVVVGLVCIIWLAYFTKNTMQAITKPLNEIFKNINKIKSGEYDLSEISNTGNEMHELCDALNEMVEVIQKEIVMTKERGLLEKRLLEIENENLRKDELLVQSEVKMLQNQINPHFLFNTLNMTYKLALQEGAPRSSEMIERTSALLRYGLDKQNKLSDLQAEIHAAENYLAIQEKRLGERVHFELIVDQELPNINIPGMILQPLVENSLKHGLKDCIEDGEVIISIHYADGIINIQVSDNGVGMDSDLLEEMQLNGFHHGEGDHLGLYNVTKRLEMFYRDQVDIGVSSSVDCGFEFSIKIEVQPYEKEFFKYINS